MASISGNNEVTHQIIISNIIFHTRLHLQEKGWSYDYFVAPEVVVKNPNIYDKYIIPDIVISDHRKGWNKPVIIIEVTKRRGFKIAQKKILNALRNIDSLKYAYIIDYDTPDSYKAFVDKNNEIVDYYGDLGCGLLDFDFTDCLR
jgi:hypothetical protein